MHAVVKSSRPAPECIRLRGVRQNNLKGFDLDVPLGRYIAVTGLSGAGKSSLVFDTLHAEGQRRYVETFSAYTRQFLDLLNKPKVDSIENIRPSIAIEQTNTVKTSRSTVGTMTELTDFFKVWFSHVAECFDPETGEKVEDDNPQSIWAKTSAAHPNRAVIVAFKVTKPANLTWPEILQNLKAQSYVRVLLAAAAAATRNPPQLHRLEDLLSASSDPATIHPQLSGASELFVVQDRITIAAAEKPRFLEAVETALHFGQGQVHLFAADGFAELGHFSRGLHSPKTGRTFRAATPALFSFNSPLGACPHCRGFGRVIEIDYRLAVPDQSLSIDQGVIKCWESEIYGESKKDLYVFTKKKRIPTNVPFASLTPEQRDYVINGEPGYGEENGKTWPQYWYGVKGFFRWLEKNTYKMHVRVFLARYRAYNPCPACGGQRLQPEALCWKWQGRTLPDLYQLPVSDLLAQLASKAARHGHDTARKSDSRSETLAYDSIVTRLRYLEQVGLGYLTLDRQSRTLSGGEVERVNLTSCLGTSLVDTLFVLDEPSVGLHPRDIDRLIAIIRTLTNAGNTVVVVEHDEAMIRAADHVIEVGPEPGGRGGHIVFEGTVSEMLRSRESVTGAYFSGRETIETPARRRPVSLGARASRPQSANAAAPSSSPQWLTFTDVSKHNLAHLTFRLPLGRFVCLSGVSGSGKSTLLDNVIYQGLLTQRLQLAEDPAEIKAITPAPDTAPFGELVLVDQSPLSKTPRSNPALYSEAWELIRELYARTPAAQEAGFNSSSFSFNSGEGRCEHCQGLGYERVEMQFLSDVFVPCPICDGRRFKPEVLAIQWNGRSVADLLATSINDALPLFTEHPEIHRRLAALETVGLGYLTLGQPLNTLSGGESQRLKLVRYLGDYTAQEVGSPYPNSAGALLLLDEPTTGLHRHDVKRLLSVLHALVDRGHSVVVIEHNLDVLKSADWLIEIGPDAGANGGRIVAEGTPEDVAAANTATSPFLRAALEAESGGRTPELKAAESAARNGASALQPSTSNLNSISSSLEIEGARENNLKNLSVAIPHRQLSVVTGVSGSGKSTLAFDIVFAEGQRRFMESMSPYARQFVEQLPRPAVDRLTGIPPTVAIEQRVTRGSRKSTVATITEVAQYLRLLYARLGIQHHPETDQPVEPLSPAQLKSLLSRVLSENPKARKARHLYLCAPLIRGRKGHHQPIATWIANQGYELMRADGQLTRVDAFQKLDRYREHDIEVVVADLKTGSPASRAKSKSSGSQLSAPSSRLSEALRLGKGSCFLLTERGEILSWFSTTRTDIHTGESFPELDPKHFSFNSPRGWCPTCRGHGRVFPWMLEPDEDAEDDPAARLREFGIDSADDVSDAGQPCPECHGARLNRIARAVKLHFKAPGRRGRRAPARASQPSALNSQPTYALSLPELLTSTPAHLLAHLRELDLDARGRLITQDIIPQIEERLRFLDHVGLGYLSLERPTETLSGGEAQRIRLAAQLGSNLSGVLYVLDEPSIGLHARDNDRLIETLQSLREKGNTLLVVEHDDELMERADRIIDLGPAAGVHGGELLANGTPAEIKRSAKSLTGLFLKKGIAHPLRGEYRPAMWHGRLARVATRAKAKLTGGTPVPQQWLELRGALFRNLKGFDLRLPLGRLIMVAGPSGAGKSTLFRDVLDPAVSFAIKEQKASLTGREFVKATGFVVADSHLSTLSTQLPFAELRGANGFKRVIEVDQSPIGKTPRSTPATYLGIFDLIRQFFASLPEAKIRGYTASRFSFNTTGGRCPTCEGAGRIKLEMAFMPDTYLPCDDCHGLRYGPELADITWKGKSIGEVLQLTFEEAAQFFDFHSQLAQVCQLMVDCGLGYLTLGQSSPTLSGGEAQRLKLVTELSAGLASYRERSRGERPRNLYLLEEPTIGLHLSDCEKLIRVLHSLVDQGHTVIVIEHHLDLLAEADYIVELGPVGGPDGGELLYQGELAGLLKVRGSPTAPYLRAKLNGHRRAQP
ncbi:excinuclease ABC subunit UvrA [Opitutus terrae]|uniref:UvrABC system protein A n=1 Tax=Opitutus terrae (strain DSM 11246 / JCM 15787 / PB90-1) TaxID=452637 RepID=B1ZV20_OPITP|nr:excinuclease ABC subunit UvrA [Opitutus terrae]ACB75990.1 excinuclease ABC, A subunit [Opitutus terrae PB90-1]